MTHVLAHWGYVMKELCICYTDGSEEVTGAGEVFYWPAGHAGGLKGHNTDLGRRRAREVTHSPQSEHSARFIDSLVVCEARCSW
jgi:hypothetical protein